MCLSSRDSARSKNVLPANVSEESAAEAAERLGRRFLLTPPPILAAPHTKTLEKTKHIWTISLKTAYISDVSEFIGSGMRKKRRAC